MSTIVQHHRFVDGSLSYATALRFAACGPEGLTKEEVFEQLRADRAIAASKTEEGERNRASVVKALRMMVEKQLVRADGAKFVPVADFSVCLEVGRQVRRTTSAKSALASATGQRRGRGRPRKNASAPASPAPEQEEQEEQAPASRANPPEAGAPVEAVAHAPPAAPIAADSVEQYVNPALDLGELPLGEMQWLNDMFPDFMSNHVDTHGLGLSSDDEADNRLVAEAMEGLDGEHPVDFGAPSALAQASQESARMLAPSSPQEDDIFSGAMSQPEVEEPAQEEPQPMEVDEPQEEPEEPEEPEEQEYEEPPAKEPVLPPMQEPVAPPPVLKAVEPASPQKRKAPQVDDPDFLASMRALKAPRAAPLGAILARRQLDREEEEEEEDSTSSSSDSEDDDDDEDFESDASEDEQEEEEKKKEPEVIELLSDDEDEAPAPVAKKRPPQRREPRDRAPLLPRFEAADDATTDADLDDEVTSLGVVLNKQGKPANWGDLFGMTTSTWRMVKEMVPAGQPFDPSIGGGNFEKAMAIQVAACLATGNLGDLERLVTDGDVTPETLDLRTGHSLAWHLRASGKKSAMALVRSHGF